jgi:hypothetical protein
MESVYERHLPIALITPSNHPDLLFVRHLKSTSLCWPERAFVLFLPAVAAALLR